MARRTHKGVQKPKLHLPYCPTLGVHHLFFEARHYNRGFEHNLRNYGAFILDTTVAKPPQHTLLHRSLVEPPKPVMGEAYDLIGAAKQGGLGLVIEQIDTKVTDHLRQQLAILAMPTQEAIERLTHKMYVTQRELARI
jgi:hypothetical protein